MVPLRRSSSFGHEHISLQQDCVEHVSEQRFHGRRLLVALSAKRGKNITLVLHGDGRCSGYSPEAAPKR